MRDEPAYRKFQRACLAVCIILAPLIVFLGFAFDPTGGVPPAPAKIFAAYQAASPLKIQLFLLFNALTPYVFPLSFIGLGLLAMRRSPWLATFGMICGLVGTLPFGFFVWPEALGDAMIKTGNISAFLAVWNGVSSEGVIIFLQYSWVAGHLLGYLLLGIALARGRALPLWAAGLIILGIPFQAIAYMAHQGIFQLISYLLIFVGSIAAALATLKHTPEEKTIDTREEAALPISGQ
jgi:hypothetical protein